MTPTHCRKEMRFQFGRYVCGKCGHTERPTWRRG